MLKNYRLNNLCINGKSYIEDEPIGKQVTKIVYQTCPTKKLPSELRSNISELKEKNPDWEFRLYDNDDQLNFVSTYYPKLLNIFTSIDTTYGAARADLFRYLIVYKFGGVYLDIKSSTSKPLNEIVTINTKYILAHWKDKSDGMHPEISNYKGEYQQWHIISVAGHPFLKAVINAVCRNSETYNPFLHGKSTYATLRVTGPIAYSLAIAPIVDKWPSTHGYDYEFGLIYSIYNSNMKSDLTHRSIFKNHYASSVMPMIKQNYLIEVTYTQTWRVIWKFRNLKERLTNVLSSKKI